MQKRKQYKALIIDVDGTLVESKRDAIPSKRVTDAIQKASKKMYVGIATGRPYYLIDHLVKHLNLSGPSIVANGAQIIDIASEKTLSEKPLLPKDIQTIYALIKNKKHITLHTEESARDYIFNPSARPQKTFNLFMTGMTKKDVTSCMPKLATIPTIIAHEFVKWADGKNGIQISDAHATKQQAILEVSKILNIQTHDMIGVGDGPNDFSFLMACGLKIAMGNAIDDIKAIADYVAPSVTEDGLAVAIEKFIL